MITKNIIVHALPRIYCLFQCLVLFPCLFKCHGFVIISPLLIACPFLNVPSILIIIKIPMFSFHKHTVNDNVNNLCMCVCVCGIAGCLLKITPRKKTLSVVSCYIYLHTCHSCSVFHLSCLCLLDWESF